MLERIKKLGFWELGDVFLEYSILFLRYCRENGSSELVKFDEDTNCIYYKVNGVWGLENEVEIDAVYNIANELKLDVSAVEKLVTMLETN